MADRNIGAEKPNGNCEPPTDRFVSGWPPPGIPAIAPALTLRHRQSRACRGATAAIGLRTDGSLENRPQRRRVQSTDELCWASESFLGRWSIGRQPYSTPAIPERLSRFQINTGVEIKGKY